MKKFQYFLITKSFGFLLNALALFNPQKAAALAYRLHSEPRVGQLNQNKLPVFLQTATCSVFVSHNLNYQTYTWHGNSETILLLHGWESNSSRWEKLLPYLLQTGKTIIAIDAPAHGLSQSRNFSVPQYATIIHDFCKIITPNYLIGHSIGGAACVYYQYLYQNPSISKMVILGAPSDLQVLINNFCKLLSLNQKLKKYLEIEFSYRLNYPVHEFSAQKFATQIAVPALIVHDYNDTVVHFSEGQKTAKLWKNANFIATQNLGHSLHDPELYQQIARFISN